MFISEWREPVLDRTRLTVTEAGLARFSWWQDWRGKYAAIIASGPSTKKTDIDLLKDRLPVIAIKKNVELCPWADVVYGCDGAWWKSVNGLPDFKGLKVAWEPTLRTLYPDINLIEIPDKKGNELLTDEPGRIGAGGNSGFQALNLAVQFGVRGVLLIGFDIADRSGVHWYGRNNWPMANNPDVHNFRRWHTAFNAASHELADRGIEVINASSISALTCFRKHTVEQALASWGL